MKHWDILRSPSSSSLSLHHTLTAAVLCSVITKNHTDSSGKIDVFMNEHYLIVSGMFFKKRKRIVKTKKLAKKKKKFDFVLSILK